MGFNLQMNYKSLDLAVFTFASVGNDMVWNYERTLSDANRLNYVLIDGQAKEQVIWRQELLQELHNVFSDYFVEDASYVNSKRAIRILT
jgi:hypothetical protein